MNHVLGKPWVRISAGLLLITTIAAAWWWWKELPPGGLQMAIADWGVWAPLGFMMLYALATVAFIPGVVLTLLGGAMFGLVWGTLINLSGATLGAGSAFLIARYLAADRVRTRAGPRLTRVLDGVEREGWRFVVFTRLVPLFPFNLLNYAFGLTRIGFGPYLLASWLAMLPGAIAYTWLGHAGGAVLRGDDGGIRQLLLALAVLVALGYLPRLWRRFRDESGDGTNDPS